RGTVAAAAGDRVIDRLTVHHTATPAVAGGREVDAAFVAESHRRRGLGLGTGDARDCAYHFVILPDGRVQAGRPLEYWGSGTRSGEDNLHSVGVALVGDFVRGGRGPTPAQMDALESLALGAFSEYGFDARSVRGHREVSASACPGALLDLDALRMSLAAASTAGRRGHWPAPTEEGSA
ncbi:MAG: N-acetylmuramoyl-L-alanine amidase, partial [Actinobacteria bacterium]